MLFGCGGGQAVEAGGALLIGTREPGGVAEFPLVREPGVEVADGPCGEVQKELGEVDLGIDLVSAAGGGQAGEDGGSPSAARVANE